MTRIDLPIMPAQLKRVRLGVQGSELLLTGGVHACQHPTHHIHPPLIAATPHLLRFMTLSIVVCISINLHKGGAVRKTALDSAASCPGPSQVRCTSLSAELSLYLHKGNALMQVCRQVWWSLMGKQADSCPRLPTHDLE